MWDFAAFTRPDHGVPANVAYAHHDSNRNVLDEWVFGCQRPSLLAEKENRQRVFVPLHLFPHLKAICVVQAQKFLKNFLSFSTAMSTLNFTARLVHPSIPAICS